mgnify:CR=1 FL=1
MAPGEDRSPDRVRAMFEAIAPRYDLLNRALSLGLDVRWRRRAVGELPRSPDARVLDLCGGTGDLSRALLAGGRAGFVVCLDFAHPMLLRASRKLRRTPGRSAVVEADALRLPFADGSFDGAAAAFGVRNLADRDAGFREVARVLRPGGRFVVLEFSRPAGPILSPLWRFHVRRIVPRLGDRVSGETGPYGYLARTIGEFPEPAFLAGRLREAGFAAAGFAPLSGGIVCVHVAVKA